MTVQEKAFRATIEDLLEHLVAGGATIKDCEISAEEARHWFTVYKNYVKEWGK